MKSKTVVILALAAGSYVIYKKFGERIKEALTPTPADPATATKGCCG